jgi:hypothetical protein
MTYNVLVEMESQIIVVEADTEVDAINVAMDAAMHNCQLQGSIIPTTAD